MSSIPRKRVIIFVDKAIINQNNKSNLITKQEQKQASMVVECSNMVKKFAGSVGSTTRI
jgi:hypothetical protein